jgi:CRISPR type III-B/RAMP module RAMP protein Cmr6
MPTAIPCDTADALGTNVAKCESRSLFASRFANPLASEKTAPTRKEWFQSLIAKKAISQTPWHPSTAKLLHAQLKARLMVNMAGGVMENAGLSLDRYGLPLIPGSAVKGCARRAALAALREWCETGAKPEGDDNLFSKVCDAFKTPAEMLSVAARTFGWVELDWSNPKSNLSDFHWACNGAAETLQSALTLLHPSKEFAGSIAFLDARPNRDPGLILDVVTPHHKDYYDGKLKTATETEDPVPVFFPAVKEQAENDHFTFLLIQLRRTDETLLTFAQESLRTGLEVFGIGAKTNTGYGWFDASAEFNQRMVERQAEAMRRKEDQDRQAAEKTRLEAEAKARADSKAALAAALGGLTPDQQEDKKLDLLSPAQFDSKVRAFCKDLKKGGPSEPEKQAIVRALRGPRLEYWQAFKAKATKGDLATVDQAIRQLSKTLNLGKMP